MCDKKKHLLMLLDDAIELAEKKKETVKNSEDLFRVVELTIKNLEDIKKNIILDIIPLHSNGSNLGLSRHIGEWCDDELMDMALDIDHYYSNEMK